MQQLVHSNQRLEYFIEQLHYVVFTASIDNISRRVVDALIALICLRGLKEPIYYEYLMQHQALPYALYRMRFGLVPYMSFRS